MPEHELPDHVLLAVVDAGVHALVALAFALRLTERDREEDGTVFVGGMVARTRILAHRSTHIGRRVGRYPSSARAR